MLVLNISHDNDFAHFVKALDSYQTGFSYQVFEKQNQIKFLAISEGNMTEAENEIIDILYQEKVDGYFFEWKTKQKYIRSPYPTFAEGTSFAREYTAWSLRPLMWLSEAFSQNECSIHKKINERAKMEGSAYRLAIDPFFKVRTYTTWRKRGGRNSFFNTL